MDLSTMRKKLDEGHYPDLIAMEKDFDLMIANCLAYNNRDTVFYRFGVKNHSTSFEIVLCFCFQSGHQNA